MSVGHVYELNGPASEFFRILFDLLSAHAERYGGAYNWPVYPNISHSRLGNPANIPNPGAGVSAVYRQVDLAAKA